VCDSVNKCCNVEKCVANISYVTPLCLPKVNGKFKLKSVRPFIICTRPPLNNINDCFAAVILIVSLIGMLTGSPSTVTTMVRMHLLI